LPSQALLIYRQISQRQRNQGVARELRVVSQEKPMLLSGYKTMRVVDA